MKVLFINSVYNWGSTGKIVASLSERCRADGIDTAVCYGRTMTKTAQPDEDNVFKFGLEWETRLHALLTRLTGRTGCFSYFSTKRLIKYMERFRPDVVNLHEPHAYFLNLKPFFAYLSEHNIPLVYTFHCEFAFTGKCGHPLGCENWKSGCGSCPRIWDYPKSMFFDCTASMLAEKKELLGKQRMIIVSPSKWLADRARQSFLMDNDIRVVRNGINTEIFRRRDTENLRKKLGLGDEKIVLAVAPKLADPHKGIRHFVALAEKMKGENVRFVIVGQKSGSEVFPENVLAVGRTENRTELAEYYSLADCFVICSDMENLPTTCLEAACCGAPIAGFDVGGTSETANEKTGLFCKYEDIDTLKENVLRFLNAPPEKEAFEDFGRICSNDYMYEQYKQIFYEIASEGE